MSIFKSRLMVSLITAASLLMVTNVSTAGDVSIVGSRTAKILIKPSPLRHQNSGGPALSEAATKPVEKTVYLQKIELSPRAQNQIADLIDSSLKQNATFSQDGNEKVELGMNGVPVLDQGAHGTCVTFAATAAIDAELKSNDSKDHISQLCNLELGKTLQEDDPRYPSGWDGSSGSIVLKQMSDYGIINNDYQHQYGCAGKTEYPRYDGSDTGNPMSKEDFIAHHEMPMQSIPYTTLVDVDNVPNRNKKAQKKLLNDVLSGLQNGHRILFGTLLALDANNDSIGLNGSYHKNRDSWVLTPSVSNTVRFHKDNLAGHEMVITGFDNDAIITDVDNKPHKGVFTIRNSWSEQAGDHGNYYISYDFFATMTLEAHEIGR